MRKDQIGHFPDFRRKEDAGCQDVRESQKSPASNTKSTFVLQQKTIAFYCFIHVKLCYDFSLFSAIYQKNQPLMTNVAFDQQKNKVMKKHKINIFLHIVHYLTANHL